MEEKQQQKNYTRLGEEGKVVIKCRDIKRHNTDLCCFFFPSPVGWRSHVCK
jgi:hypothetical protein